MIDEFAIKEEIVVYLRNNLTDIHSPVRIVNNTEYFDGDNTTKLFELTEDLSENSEHRLKNVIYATVNNSTMTNYTDYIVYYVGTNKGNISFASAPSNVSSNNIEVNYDFGPSWIFTKMPDQDITVQNTPRIGVDILTMNTVEAGIGGGANVTEVVLQIAIVANNTYDIDRLTKSVRDLILARKTGFYNFDLILDPRTSPILPIGRPEQKLLKKTITWSIPLQYEFV